jgi:hypothetical protein
MALTPDDGRNWTGAETAPEEAILSLLRDKYHAEIMPLVRSFFDFSNLVGLASTPNYEIFDIISNETRSALDHIARASVSVDATQALLNVEFSKWHLDLARIRILIALVEYIREILDSARDYVTRRDRRKVSEVYIVEDRTMNFHYLATLRHAAALIDPKGELTALVIAPSVEEIATTKALADELSIIASGYSQLTADLWKGEKLPSVYELNRWKNRRQLFRQPWNSRIFRGALISGLIATSIAASLPFLYSGTYNIIFQTLIVVLGMALGGYRASRA